MKKNLFEELPYTLGGKSYLHFSTEEFRKAVERRADLFLLINGLSPQSGNQLVAQAFAYALANMSKGICAKCKRNLFETILAEMAEVFARDVLGTQEKDCSVEGLDIDAMVKWETDAMRFLDKPYAYFPHSESERDHTVNLFYLGKDKEKAREIAKDLGAIQGFTHKVGEIEIETWTFSQRNVNKAIDLGVGFTTFECFQQFLFDKKREDFETQL